MNDNRIESNTVITNLTRINGPSAFEITGTNVPVDTTAASFVDGLPTFAVTINGLQSNSAYFYLDFTSDTTVVWN